ncbi:hypothetical protein [Halalkalibacterium ligniniphilum]|uniref:hypothetical protein n=1 Tax=Halalkalibacterium ligniniphilum TaxID=1134413 RepID=UPI000349C123|nr:hypothetical protein [Halalkalibacterium ligniniphilum]
MPNFNDFQIQKPVINDLHDEGLIQTFVEGIGKKVFILTPSFPFLFIGKIIDVIGDHLMLDVETSSIQQLENRKWHVHIHQIEAFYIETSDGPKIPELKDDLT